MTILRDPFGQDAAEPEAKSQPPAPPASSSPSAEQDRERSDLRHRRDALAEQVTELHWDLGGLAYEMAIRDHFRLDVLVRRAAVLQERDAQLAEVERLLRMEQDGVAGSCTNCAAPHSRGALYCWQCGTTLMERRPSSAFAEQDGATSVMDALLANGIGLASHEAAHAPQEAVPASHEAISTPDPAAGSDA
jgi:hypothetical protein